MKKIFEQWLYDTFGNEQGSDSWFNKKIESFMKHFNENSDYPVQISSTPKLDLSKLSEANDKITTEQIT